MSILFVLEHFHPYIGGVEFLFWQLAKSLVERGHKVKVITTRFDKALPLEETIEGIEIQRVNCANRFTFSYKSIPSIFASANSYDIIHTTTYNAAIPAWLVAFFKRKKCVLTFHEYWGKLWEQLPYLNFYERILFRSFERSISLLTFTKVIAVSEYTRNSLIQAGIPPAKIVSIYNGLNYQNFNSNNKITNQLYNNNSWAFIFVGRLGVSKGLDLLIPAADIFLQKNPNAILKLVIPKRPEKMYLLIKKEIEKLKSFSQIKLMHNLPKEDLYREMQTAAFIVIPSYSEGFCFVAADACAMGVPVVSSQKGALAEVVSGKHIVIEDFSIKGLTVALQKAAEQKWQQSSLKKFPLSESIEQYIQVYKEIIND